MSCKKCGKVSISCGTTIFSPCVTWEVPEDLQDIAAGLDSDEPVECVNLDFALTDIYERIDQLTQFTDFSEFESDCLEPEEVEGEATLQTVIKAIDQKLCELSEAVDDDLTACSILDMDISECGLDLSCFETTTCETPLGNSLKNLLQEIINRICALEAA